MVWRAKNIGYKFRNLTAGFLLALSGCPGEDIKSASRTAGVVTAAQSDLFSYETATQFALVGKSAKISPRSMPSEEIKAVKTTPILPTGLSISSDAVITGIPTSNSVATAYTVIIRTSTMTYQSIVTLEVLTEGSGFSYSQSKIMLVAGQFSEVRPDQGPITNPFDSISISPSLPSGLTLSNTGIISGTPGSVSQEVLYKITAKTGSTLYNTSVNFYVLVMGSGFEYSPTTTKFMKGQSVSIVPTMIPAASFDSISVLPSLPAGLAISSNGVISGSTSDSFAETSYAVTAISGSVKYSSTVKLKSVVLSTEFSYVNHLVKSEVVSISPTQIPDGTFDSVVSNPSLPNGLIISNNGQITGAATSASSQTNYLITATSGLTEYHSTVTLKVSEPLALSSTVTPLTESSVSITWNGSAAAGLNGYRIQLSMADGSKQNYFMSSSAVSKVLTGLSPGSKFSVRLRALLDPPNVGDTTDLVTIGWTPYGAINADSVSTPPQEPWKPSGIDGAVFSERFSIVWSFYWNPGFTPVWAGVPSKRQKGDFYYNTKLNENFGTTWLGYDDITQLWTNGVDKFMVGTWRGNLHLFDYLPNSPTKVLPDRRIGQGLTNRSTFGSGAYYTSSACYDTSTGKLYVTNAGRNRVLVFNSWPTTIDPDADFVLGQPDFDTFSGATTATGMSAPSSVSCEGGIVAVADMGNNRILVWTKAITANNQAADFIYGQANATTGGANGGGTNMANFGINTPPSVLLVPRSAGGYALVVADIMNNRVLEWDKIPATPASQTFPGEYDRVYGQPNRSSGSANSEGRSMSSLAGPGHLSHERDVNGVPKSDIFWVTDGVYWTTHNDRVLKFQRGNSTAIDVWGEADGVSLTSGWDDLGASRTGFWWGNYYGRISCLGSSGVYNLGGYIWKSAPSNGVTASDFTDGSRCHAVAASGKSWLAKGDSIYGVNTANPADVASPLPTPAVLLGRKNLDDTVNTSIADSFEYKINGVGAMEAIGSSILVLDSHRIAIWDTTSLSNHAKVSRVIGQPSISTNAANHGGLSPATLSSPSYMIVYNNKIIIADTGNNRVLIYNSLPTTDGAAANVILGQPDGVTSTAGAGLTNLSGPTSVAVINGKLVVADPGNKRTLVWDTLPTATGTAASRSIDLRSYRFSLPSWYNPDALYPRWIGFSNGKVYIDQYGRSLVIPDIF